MIKYIVVDDKRTDRELLKLMIRENFNDVEIVGEANNVNDGVRIINTSQFDILFLDVELGELNGFDLLGMVTNRDYKVIFATGFEKYAIQAIEAAALFYLVKPFTDESIVKAIRAFKLNQHGDPGQIKTLLKNHIGKKQRYISLMKKNVHEEFEISTIAYCQSDSNYTTFYFDNNDQATVAKTLSFYEKLLSANNFVRVHNSFLVNLTKIKKVQWSENSCLTLSDNPKIIPISRGRKESFRRIYLANHDRF